MALDKMTLAEIEALFAEDRVASFGLPIPGEAHDAVPGAIFFEV